MTQRVSSARDVATPVRVPKTAELVAAHLRRQIVRSELQEGDALPPEATLMEQFGVSRPTLREAFRVLESEALISVRRGARGGARVHAPDDDVAARYAGLVLQFRGTTLLDVYEARRAIELPAVRALAKRTSATTISTLRHEVDETRAVIDDPVAAVRSQLAFHMLVVHLAGNKTLTLFAEMIQQIIRLHHESYVARRGTASEQDQNIASGGRAHARLVDLIESGDTDKAEAHWRRHLDEASEFTLRGTDATTVLDVLS
jgi:DNA-binding FadR family transcriptional regulator